MQLGWAVWQHENLFIEAEPHAVFDPGNGHPWTDPTPTSFSDGSQCQEILFIPHSDDNATHDPEDTVTPDNIRVPLVDDPRLLEALKLSSERIAFMNRVEREWQYGSLIFHYSPEAKKQMMLLEFRIASLLSAMEESAKTPGMDMESMLAADDGDIDAMKRTNFFRQMLRATPAENHGKLEAMFAEMISQAKGKLTGEMRAVIEKAIRAA
jgi:hypothetical protein